MLKIMKLDMNSIHPVLIKMVLCRIFAQVTSSTQSRQSALLR